MGAPGPHQKPPESLLLRDAVQPFRRGDFNMLDLHVIPGTAGAGRPSGSQREARVPLPSVSCRPQQWEQHPGLPRGTGRATSEPASACCGSEPPAPPRTRGLSFPGTAVLQSQRDLAKTVGDTVQQVGSSLHVLQEGGSQETRTVEGKQPSCQYGGPWT